MFYAATLQFNDNPNLMIYIPTEVTGQMLRALKGPVRKVVFLIKEWSQKYEQKQ
jgi:hypothetical protein